jgi:hypothetical protein
MAREELHLTDGVEGLGLDVLVGAIGSGKQMGTDSGSVSAAETVSGELFSPLACILMMGLRPVVPPHIRKNPIWELNVIKQNTLNTLLATQNG